MLQHTMTLRSRFLLLGMSTAFGLCILGLLFGLLFDLYAVFLRHRSFENVLGNSIPYYKTLGAVGIAGMLLFFALLVSLIFTKNQGKPR
jgi:hypothetical protein